MRIVLQRVKQAQVIADGELTGQIGVGVLLLIAVAPGDTMQEANWLIEKVLRLRLFDDPKGFLQRSLEDVNGEVLLVSQFTLYADIHKGSRPSFSKAMPPNEARPIYEAFVNAFRVRWPNKVHAGRFGADMQVSLVNDGPVTIILDRVSP